LWFVIGFVGTNAFARICEAGSNSSTHARREAIRLCASLRRAKSAQLALGGSGHEGLLMVVGSSGGYVGQRCSGTRTQNTVSHACDTARVNEGAWWQLPG
jgi:hypothetical protein